MEDVIFAGSSGRRPMGMAEVDLVFDNTDHSLPVDFDEVSLQRRVFRSGDSEYIINGKNCRLKDVVALFADTGLGRGSLSIIGQNKIDEILNSRPEDRRSIFEEAAGIANTGCGRRKPCGNWMTPPPTCCGSRISRAKSKTSWCPWKRRRKRPGSTGKSAAGSGR